jgi:exodeoxyribonuclease VII small subunit
MSDENQLDSTSFNKNYKVLKDTADWLSTQKEPDIDQLVPKVEKAMKAYQICKERLSKVQETLGQYFEKDEPTDAAGAPRGDGVAHGPVQARPSAGGDEDDSGL